VTTKKNDTRSKMHLAGFQIAGAVTHSHAAWRHPKSAGNFFELDYYANIARILERAKFDFLFFADVLATPRRYGNDITDPLRRGTQGAFGLDPMMVAAGLAGVTDKLGLAVTKSTTYFSPYDIARSFASLDHLSGGRFGWNVVTSLSQAEGQNFGFEEMLGHDTRYDRADEFLEVAFKLWGSWEQGAILHDREAGVFADPSKVHEINHVGPHFKVRGPLNVPHEPQSRPVIIQAGSSGRGKDYAARWAEAIFEIDPSPDSRRAYYADVKARAAAFGRDPSRIKIFPAVMPFVGATESEAREKQAFHNELADPISGLITMSMHTDIDFSRYQIDEPIQAIDAPGSKGLFAVVNTLSQKKSLTLRDVGKLYAQGIVLPQFVGTASQVADQLEAAWAGEEADGFMISAGWSPGAFEDFTAMVVPELQRRGLFRTEYEGKRLRDHLGLGEANLTPVPRQRYPEAGAKVA
jgi:FMN-dependent oxidoreductase (nitrilotriacetate monooxygenase family)